MNLVVDACVFVAEQIEDQSEFAAADEFFEHCVRNGVRLYAPAIVLAEVAGAVARIVDPPYPRARFAIAPRVERTSSDDG